MDRADTVPVRHYSVFFKMMLGAKTTVRRCACGVGAEPCTPIFEEVTCPKCLEWGKNHPDVVWYQQDYWERWPVAQAATAAAKKVLERREAEEMKLVSSLPLLPEGRG